MATESRQPQPVTALTVNGRWEASQELAGLVGPTDPEEQFLAALKLFETGRVTTAKAAEMCGMASVDFLLAAERSHQPRPFTRV
jgi:predicted HTH domain antitoxin